MWINMVFVCGIIFLCGCVGLVMYSRYFDCDPLTSQVRKVKHPFQLYVQLKVTMNYLFFR
jgi:hypothetical protein